MSQMVLASGNKHKQEEIQALVSTYGWNLVPMKEAGFSGEDIEETGTTFEENALIKAQAVIDALGVAVVADDSGLEVDALNGSPGVYSARYAGESATYEDNNKKLLAALKGVPKGKRTARFVTVLTCLFPNGDKLVARGEVIGEILETPQGEEGFGYDPLFYLPELGKTYAELSGIQKNKISHRGKALEILKEKLDKRQKSL